ncbi:uncharacterized protein KGF55_000166 [Candida pseudojiufengensis]|uniref:uncharacterized protein n=1 Tax=Candida pseudojiufengensis TaxID=497109 RepID=UPI002224E119|nr:uncharacterized protein KGF55_000166 [Candida pseudojiufengensis]KAI5966757.1 hypothetical protein KGF55_000166 [Candida pseudojiufengensis]
MPPPTSPVSLPQESTQNNQNNQNSLRHIRRFGNASSESFPTLNSLNIISDYIYRNENGNRVNEETNTLNDNSQEAVLEANFRSRILRHFSEIHRLQNHFNTLVNSSESNTRDTTMEELPNNELNSLPTQLRNLSRELSRSRNREAYSVDSTEEDDQSFQFEDENEQELIYYSDDDHSGEETTAAADSNVVDETTRNEIRSNERLLLTSARNLQNATTPLISGVPLRRQNAIRIKSILRKDDGAEEQEEEESKKLNDKLVNDYLDSEAQILEGEIKTVLDSFESAKATTSLFPQRNFGNFQSAFFSSFNILLPPDPSHDTYNITESLDEFLWKRNNKLLFIDPKIPAPPTASSSKKRVKETKPTNTKRQKLSATKDEPIIQTEREIYNYPYHKLDKNQIMDGLPTNEFQSGSSYSLQLKSPGFNTFKLSLINIEPKIHATIGADPEGSLETLFLKLHNFTKFLCGMPANSYQLPRNAMLIRKLNVLDRLSIDDNIIYSKSKPIRTFYIPCDGTKVDFKNNDLRFMKSEKLVSSRFNVSKIRLQLLEWMKINPFIQFKENFLFNFLQNLHQDLHNFKSIKVKRSRKSEAIHLTREFKSNFPEIAKDFNNIKISYPQFFKNDENKRKKRYHAEMFLEDWKSSLAFKLSDLLTAENCSTIINVQLNYILFTLDINISQFLNSFINLIFHHCENQEYIENYRKIYNNILRDEKEDLSCTLLCSIHKTSGRLDIHNTFLHINPLFSTKLGPANVILTDDSRLNEVNGRNMYVYDDFEKFNGSKIPKNSKEFNLRFEQDEGKNDENDTSKQDHQILDKLVGFVNLDSSINEIL